MPGTIVRAARPDEWDRYRALRLRGLATDPRAFGARHDEEAAQPDAFWRGRLEDPLNVTLVAGEWDGLCTLRGERGADHEILGMWVSPDARGRGLAHALLDAALHEARSRGAREVALWVNVEQEAAVRVYARAGFVPEGPPMRGTRDPTRVFQRMVRAA